MSRSWSQRPVDIFAKTDILQMWKRAISLSWRAAKQGKYSCTAYGREPESQFQKCGPTNWWAAEVLAELTVSICAPGGLGPWQGQGGPCESSPISSQSTQHRQLTRAREENVPESESRRVIPCAPIQLKTEAAPATSLYCQGDEYL